MPIVNLHIPVDILEWQVLIVPADLLFSGSLATVLKVLGERTRAAEVLPATVATVVAEKTVFDHDHINAESL